MKTIAGPFVRIFVAKAEAAHLLKTLTEVFEGKIDFQFDHAPTESTVYSVRNSLGLYSITATDKAQPDFVSKTKAVYVVENVDEVLENARKNNVEVAQEKTPVSVGFQSRLKISEDCYFEIVEWSAEHIAKMKVIGLLK
ncbi:hypothetical protein RFI36_09965 [Acinetobacter gerneri]|uniref:VOC family protein n=1 Tax=Acinetobacter gerneri TaxID=202952 RepID=A0AAW8JJ78_9GAMM|nr:hypothetical protein [Acinetobacter gerneri]MDQ9009959.1 hypothetical protein [Acinetobacter gerneri]MDQ9014121.1 hypothetical protein [Acinetobacter gerneri]MDQ9025237.1 hypothetical protein [Acinetobacter gerneri]MDQ9050780.1 hypothetical protein [Acinetobacter gerneri]MDQ9060241.1 hypothetical protein [Acinetobacter gerneri]